MAEQDLSNFYLMDIAQSAEGVYELAGGVIRETAEYLGVDLGKEPNSEALGNLVGKIGKNKVLRDNKEVTAIDRGTVIDLVERSGVQKELNRSLWTPDISADELDAAALTGAVANWQDRAVMVVEAKIPRSTPVYVATGDRVMDTATEQKNPNVVSYFKRRAGTYPTEMAYGIEVVGPRLETSHDEVILEGFNTTNGDDVARLLFESHPELLDGRVGFVRVANAGIQLAVQMRTAARVLYPGFDADPKHPQVLILTDTFALAENEEQESQPQSYQKAITALRQMALTGKMLHEAAGGE